MPPKIECELHHANMCISDDDHGIATHATAESEQTRALRQCNHEYEGVAKDFTQAIADTGSYLCRSDRMARYDPSTHKTVMVIPVDSDRKADAYNTHMATCDVLEASPTQIMATQQHASHRLYHDDEGDEAKFPDVGHQNLILKGFSVGIEYLLASNAKTRRSHMNHQSSAPAAAVKGLTWQVIAVGISWIPTKTHLTLLKSPTKCFTVKRARHILLLMMESTMIRSRRYVLCVEFMLPQMFGCA